MDKRIEEERNIFREALEDIVISFDDGDVDTANIRRIRELLLKYP
jgi:hypothetical protein